MTSGLGFVKEVKGLIAAPSNDCLLVLQYFIGTVLSISLCDLISNRWVVYASYSLCNFQLNFEIGNIFL